MLNTIDCKELFTTKGKSPLQSLGISSGRLVKKEFDSRCKSYVIKIDGNVNSTRVRLPPKKSFSSQHHHRYLIVQMYPLGGHLYLELNMRDERRQRRRFIFSSSFSKVNITQFHVKLPFRLNYGKWYNMCFDTVSIFESCFKWPKQFSGLEYLLIGPKVKVRKIFSMKKNPRDMGYVIPKGVNFLARVLHETVVYNVQKDNNLISITKLEKGKAYDGDNGPLSPPSPNSMMRRNIKTTSAVVGKSTKPHIAFGRRFGGSVPPGSTSGREPKRPRTISNSMVKSGVRKKNYSRNYKSGVRSKPKMAKLQYNYSRPSKIAYSPNKYRGGIGGDTREPPRETVKKNEFVKRVTPLKKKIKVSDLEVTPKRKVEEDEIIPEFKIPKFASSPARSKIRFNTQFEEILSENKIHSPEKTPEKKPRKKYVANEYVSPTAGSRKNKNKNSELTIVAKKKTSPLIEKKRSPKNANLSKPNTFLKVEKIDVKSSVEKLFETIEMLDNENDDDDDDDDNDTEEDFGESDIPKFEITHNFGNDNEEEDDSDDEDDEDDEDITVLENDDTQISILPPQRSVTPPISDNEDEEYDSEDGYIDNEEKIPNPFVNDDNTSDTVSPPQKLRLGNVVSDEKGGIDDETLKFEISGDAGHSDGHEKSNMNYSTMKINDSKLGEVAIFAQSKDSIEIEGKVPIINENEIKSSKEKNDDDDDDDGVRIVDSDDEIEDEVRLTAEEEEIENTNPVIDSNNPSPLSSKILGEGGALSPEMPPEGKLYPITGELEGDDDMVNDETTKRIEDEVELIYDPVIKCYYNPKTNKYYTLK